MQADKADKADITAALGKEKKLIKILKSLGKVAVAYSGGVDSTYLMTVAKETLGENSLALFVKGAMLAAAEEKDAQEFAAGLDFAFRVLEFDIFAENGFVENSPQRCYYCKRALFSLLKSKADMLGYHIVDGSNISDLGDFRPGLLALRELGVASPMLTAGLAKDEIRLLANRRGLPNWNKPAQACLASRVPFGDRITPEILIKVAAAEQVLTLLGFTERRVRFHGNITRIEIPSAQFALLLEHREEIVKELNKLGLRYITLDLEGIRSGSLNP